MKQQLQLQRAFILDLKTLQTEVSHPSAAKYVNAYDSLHFLSAFRQ